MIGLVVTAAVGAAAPVAKPIPVQCTATGLKHFAPGMSADRICQRFVQAYARASGTAVAMRAIAPGRSGIVVDLGFRPPGIASARVVRMRAGELLALPVYELAVSDRKFLSSDVDRLAADVARGVTGGPNIGPGIGATRNERN